MHPCLSVVGLTFVYVIYVAYNEINVTEVYELPIESVHGAYLDEVTHKVIGDVQRFAFPAFNDQSAPIVSPLYHMECINSGNLRSGAAAVLYVGERHLIALTAAHITYGFDPLAYLNMDPWMSRTLKCHPSATIFLPAIECKLLEFDTYYDQAFIQCDFNSYYMRMTKERKKIKAAKVDLNFKPISNTKIIYFKEYIYDSFDLKETPKYLSSQSIQIQLFAPKLTQDEMEFTERSIDNNVSYQAWNEIHPIISVSGKIDYQSKEFYYHRLLQMRGFSGSPVALYSDKDVIIGTIQGWNGCIWFWGHGRNRFSGLNHSFFQRCYEKYVTEIETKTAQKHEL